ncbi:MAG: hypothetical protein EBS29_12295, partial [Chloroflexia bacterium]|nr:hypothetical protein [Chloroflexia bacterium]
MSFLMAQNMSAGFVLRRYRMGVVCWFVFGGLRLALELNIQVLICFSMLCLRGLHKLAAPITPSVAGVTVGELVALGADFAW